MAGAHAAAAPHDGGRWQQHTADVAAATTAIDAVTAVAAATTAASAGTAATAASGVTAVTTDTTVNAAAREICNNAAGG